MYFYLFLVCITIWQRGYRCDGHATILKAISFHLGLYVLTYIVLLSSLCFVHCGRI